MVWGGVEDQGAAPSEQWAECVEGVSRPERGDRVVIGAAEDPETAMRVDVAEVGGAQCPLLVRLSGVERNGDGGAAYFYDGLSGVVGDGGGHAGHCGSDRAEGFSGGFGVEVGERGGLGESVAFADVGAVGAVVGDGGGGEGGAAAVDRDVGGEPRGGDAMVEDDGVGQDDDAVGGAGEACGVGEDFAESAG